MGLLYIPLRNAILLCKNALQTYITNANIALISVAGSPLTILANKVNEVYLPVSIYMELPYTAYHNKAILTNKIIGVKKLWFSY